MSENTIPPMTHPLSSHWAQPETSAIVIDDTHALMSTKTFLELCDYSASISSGVYAGKMWRALYGDTWYLRWFADKPGTSGLECRGHTREILVVD